MTRPSGGTSWNSGKVNRKYVLVIGVCVRVWPPMRGDHPVSATTGSTLMPTVWPGITGMVGTRSPAAAPPTTSSAHVSASIWSESNAQHAAC